MRFTFEVAETTVIVREYTVEASSEAEARELATRGETITEGPPLRLGEVINREIVSD